MVGVAASPAGRPSWDLFRRGDDAPSIFQRLAKRCETRITVSRRRLRPRNGSRVNYAREQLDRDSRKATKSTSWKTGNDLAAGCTCVRPRQHAVCGDSACRIVGEIDRTFSARSCVSVLSVRPACNHGKPILLSPSIVLSADSVSRRRVNMGPKSAV